MVLGVPLAAPDAAVLWGSVAGMLPALETLAGLFGHAVAGPVLKCLDGWPCIQRKGDSAAVEIDGSGSSNGLHTASNPSERRVGCSLQRRQGAVSREGRETHETVLGSMLASSVNLVRNRWG